MQLRQYPAGSLSRRSGFTWIWMVIALGLITSIEAWLSLFLFDGFARVAYVVSLGALGLGSLAWGTGLLLAGAAGDRPAQSLPRPLIVLTGAALAVSLAVILTR